METKFQTSFIPKKPLAQQSSVEPTPHQGTSLLMVIGVCIFVISLIGAGLAYGWKYYLINQRASYVTTLQAREKEFNLEQIRQFKQTDSKIAMAKQLLANHLATSQVIDRIARLTSDNIRFTSMTIDAQPNKGVNVSMSGYGPNYETLAFQSDVLGQLEQYGLRDIVINPAISNPVQSSQNSTVGFDFSASIAPSNISYERLVVPPPEGSASSTEGDTSGTSQ